MSSLYQHSCKVATVKGWAMYRQIPSSVKKTDKLTPLSIHGCGIVRIQGEGLIFRKGEILCKVPQEQLVDKLMEEIEKL